MLFIYFLLIYILLKIYKGSVKEYNICNKEKQNLQLELNNLKFYLKENNIVIDDKFIDQSKPL